MISIGSQPDSLRLHWIQSLPLLLVLVSASRLPALEYGLNCGAPIIASTGQITGSTNPDVMQATGAQSVRVNFILGPWTAPDDPTLRGPANLTWYETYDQIIDGYLSRGVQVYGLIGAESVANSSRDRLNTEPYVADLTQNALKIIDHFRGRVFVYEIFNEPNDWAGGTTAQVEPRWLARYMESVYSAVKIDNGHASDPSWQAITLVTGPLFTHDLDLGGPYLSQVFQAGTTQLQWEAIKQSHGNYPFDGVGIHIYVKQGWEPENEVAQYLTRNLDSTYGALTALEGSSTTKKLYLSEFGWNSAYTSEANQATKMETAWSVFEVDPRIAQAHWFTLTDWAGNDWGIYRHEPYIEANRKPAYYVFQSHAAQGTGTDNAAVVSHTIPLWMEPAATAPVSIQMRNSGTSTWEPGSGVDRPVVFAAGAIALGFDTANAFPWSAFASGGVSNAPSDQRAYLASTIAPAATATFSFSLTAPTTLPRGPKPFTGGMVRNSNGLFGESISIYPLVVYRSESLAANGSFETGDLTGWTQFGQTDGSLTGPWFAGITPSHGTRFLGAAANYGQKNGGAYQTFDAVPGELYGAVAQVQTYREGGAAGDTACRIGLDPQGGTNPAASGIQWSSWTENQGGWIRIATRAAAQSSQVTLFLQMRQLAPVWNVTAFDDIIVGGPTPVNGIDGYFIY